MRISDWSSDVGSSDLRHPVKGFFSALDVSLPWESDPVPDAMPVAIDALESWAVGDRMLADMLDGIHPDRAQPLEWQRGTLPPGQLGWRARKSVGQGTRESVRVGLGGSLVIKQT